MTSSHPPKRLRTLLPRNFEEIMSDESPEEFFRKPKSQADRLIRKFGGARNLMRILKKIGEPLTAATIYRWAYPKEKGGTGGLIPTRTWPTLFRAAKYAGVFISQEETDPRSIPLRMPSIGEREVMTAKERKKWK